VGTLSTVGLHVKGPNESPDRFELRVNQRSGSGARPRRGRSVALTTTGVVPWSAEAGRCNASASIGCMTKRIWRCAERSVEESASVPQSLRAGGTSAVMVAPRQLDEVGK